MSQPTLARKTSGVIIGAAVIFASTTSIMAAGHPENEYLYTPNNTSGPQTRLAQSVGPKTPSSSSGTTTGGAEKAIKCVIPNKSFDEATNVVKSFFTEYLGPNGTNSVGRNAATSNRDYFHATGVNVEDKSEQLFLRVYLRGHLIARSADDPYFFRDGRRTMFPDSPLLAVHTSFTVSSQASDDATNYREPGYPVDTRLWKGFLARLERFLAASAPGAFCEDTLW